MYERFTDRARKVMQLANQEAQRFNHEYLGTEHILLGLIKEGNGIAANVLRNLAVDLHKIRLDVEKLILSGPDLVTMGKLPQTPRARKVIEYAMEESRCLNHSHVGTEHILLGLLREDEGVAAQILMNNDVRLEDVRGELMAILAHGEGGGIGRAEEPKNAIAEPPTVCPKCGQARIVRVLWGWVHLWGQKEEDVRSGKAILAARHGRTGPAWVCLDCAPGWSEVHRLATQEWQWQLAKEHAVTAADFEKAAWYREPPVRTRPAIVRRGHGIVERSMMPAKQSAESET